MRQAKMCGHHFVLQAEHPRWQLQATATALSFSTAKTADAPSWIFCAIEHYKKRWRKTLCVRRRTQAAMILVIDRIKHLY